MTRAQILNGYLAEVRHKKLRPGSHDCGLFVAGWVKALTGEDHAKPYRGRYRSLKRLAEIMAEDGYDSHVDYVAGLFEEIPPSFAQTGDICVADDDALGIFASDRIMVLTMTDGLGSLSRLRAKRSFRV